MVSLSVPSYHTPLIFLGELSTRYLDLQKGTLNTTLKVASYVLTLGILPLVAYLCTLLYRKIQHKPLAHLQSQGPSNEGGIGILSHLLYRHRTSPTITQLQIPSLQREESPQIRDYDWLLKQAPLYCNEIQSFLEMMQNYELTQEQRFEIAKSLLKQQLNAIQKAKHLSPELLKPETLQAFKLERDQPRILGQMVIQRFHILRKQEITASQGDNPEIRSHKLRTHLSHLTSQLNNLKLDPTTIMEEISQTQGWGWEPGESEYLKQYMNIGTK